MTMTKTVTEALPGLRSNPNLSVPPYRGTQEIGRRDWTRTNDPHHVKVVLTPGNPALALVCDDRDRNLDRSS